MVLNLFKLKVPVRKCQLLVFFLWKNIFTPTMLTLGCTLHGHWSEGTPRCHNTQVENHRFRQCHLPSSCWIERQKMETTELKKVKEIDFDFVLLRDHSERTLLVSTSCAKGAIIRQMTHRQDSPDSTPQLGNSSSPLCTVSLSKLSYKENLWPIPKWKSMANHASQMPFSSSSYFPESLLPIPIPLPHPLTPREDLSTLPQCPLNVYTPCPTEGLRPSTPLQKTNKQKNPKSPTSGPSPFLQQIQR